MVCEMEGSSIEEMDMEVLPSMWPEDIGSEIGKQFNMEKPEKDQDMLELVTIMDEPTIVDFQRLMELTNYSEKGSSQLTYLMKQWEHKQANAVRLLREEYDNLSRRRQEVELRKLEILKEHRFEEESYVGDKRPVSILDEVYDIWQDVPRTKNEIVVHDERIEIDAEYDSIKYWKQKAQHLEKQLQASIQREQVLLVKLEESIKNLERQSSPVEELFQILKRADNYLHFVLQNAPVVIGHQDNELRYRFIYNHFPSLEEQDIIGKTDVEIFTGCGVKESQDFKKEVLEKGVPAKREITFETELFGSKTFLIYVEPVFSKSGEKIGINYMGMDVSDQVRKRERMAKLREEIAVQKAKETELNKTIHITEETMRAKQLLATMSHEIRSPLSGVVSMAEILSTTKLDREQRQLLDVMISSGDLVLQLINDILDLSKVESGVMKLEATKFRPREVVKHVLQTAAASLRKSLTLEGYVSDDVPIEIVGDVLRIRQILTNLISNAIKFTHEGKVGIELYVVQDPNSGKLEGREPSQTQTQSMILENGTKNPGTHSSSSQVPSVSDHTESDGVCESRQLYEESGNDMICESPKHQEQPHFTETTVWIRCDVHDTGIGIPDKAMPNLFKRYMQVSADHARKYGGTGLGLAICKQLVELMGGQLTVTSKEHCGSTFTFVLPYKVSIACDHSDDADELSDGDSDHTMADDATEGFFQFQPRTLGSLFSSNGSTRPEKLIPRSIGYSSANKLNGFSQNPYLLPSNDIKMTEQASIEDTDAVANVPKLSKSIGPVSHHPKLEENSTCIAKAYQHTKHVEIKLSANSTHCKEAISVVAPTTTTRDSQKKCQGPEKSDDTSLRRNTNTSEVQQVASEPKILLVEDNKINVMVAQSMMKQLGYKIDVVNNGSEAVRAVQRHHYDLILMDVYMPVMNGLEATKLIRSFEETGTWDAAEKAGIEKPVLHFDLLPSIQNCVHSTKRVPIIAMTANSLTESAEECFAIGMDNFVSKPVTFQKLKECLEQYLP